MDIRERLRAETRKDHEELEAIGLSDKISAGTLDREEYKKLIGVQFLLHQALEEQLLQLGVEEHFPELHFRERQKLPLLAQDLQELSMNEEGLNDLQPAGHLPKVSLPSGILGSMYVMEGATLGGMVISKALRKNEKLAEIPEFHYYGCYGGETGKQWKAFLEVLQERGNHPQAQEAIISVASQTFRFFKENFRKFL